jgi:SPP1 family predicted phage head-tail adaptor
MRAGTLRHRVVIKQPSTARDAAGAPTETLTTIATIWANVGFASGRERWANEHTVNNYDAVVTIRYRSDLTEDMQVHHDGRVLDIKAIIDPFGNKSDLKLLCVDHG